MFPYILAVVLTTKLKHTKYGSTNSLGHLVCDNTPLSNPTTMFSCIKPHTMIPFGFPTKSHVSVESLTHNWNVTMIQKIIEQKVDKNKNIEIASPQPQYQKGLKSKQPPTKKIKLFENEPNDKKLKPMTPSISSSGRLESRFKFIFEL